MTYVVEVPFDIRGTKVRFRKGVALHFVSRPDLYVTFMSCVRRIADEIGSVVIEASVEDGVVVSATDARGNPIDLSFMSCFTRMEDGRWRFDP